MKKQKLLAYVALLAPVLFIFKNFFAPGPLAYGDAPNFFPEEIRQLVNLPTAWTSLGSNFGQVNSVIFLWPLMFLYGLVGNNDLAIRLIFYFPSLGLSILGAYFLGKYLKLKIISLFFLILVYTLNTYYLLLIDGGQVGIALSYGLFPIALLSVRKMVDFFSVKNFYTALIFSTILTVADPRIAVICFVTVSVWTLTEFRLKNLFSLVSLFIPLALINSFWLLPLLINKFQASPFFPEDLKIIKWYNPLLLYSPNWPDNLFGKATRPPLYFAFVPLLIFSSLIFDRSKKIISLCLSYLVFSVLSLGLPFISNIPFGFAFRDPTKFFIPLALFGGTLIGTSAYGISERLKAKSVRYLFLGCLYLYLLFLVNKAITGKLNFVLGNRIHSQDYQKIYENLKKDTNFYRSVWFPERHPLTFETDNHPAIDANRLVNFPVFASLNTGENPFNFLNGEKFTDWFRVLGIRYLIFSGNSREISKDDSEKKDWNTILELASSNKKLEKVDWDQDIPVYKVNESGPHFYAVKNLVGIVGPRVTDLGTFPQIYFEDGKLDPKLLEDKPKESLKILFNESGKEDLAMSFLQKYFVSAQSAQRSEWATYGPGDYLKYKYQLLIRGIDFVDFDYGRGLAFSTKKGEKVIFNFKVPISGDYVIVERKLVPNNNQKKLTWETASVSLARGSFTHVIENTSDISVLNVVGLIPKEDFEQAKILADELSNRFASGKAEDLSKDIYQEVRVEEFKPLKYKVTVPENFHWIIFTDNYHPLWRLQAGDSHSDSIPVFSMVNGFYLPVNREGSVIEFEGQKNVSRGLYISGASILALVILYLWFSSKRKEKYN